MKKFLCFLSTIVVSMMLNMTAFAAITPYPANQDGTWQQRGKDWYYVLADGTELKNGYVDGYYLSYTGRMINEEPEERAVNRIISAFLTLADEDYIYNETEYIFVDNTFYVSLEVDVSKEEFRRGSYSKNLAIGVAPTKDEGKNVIQPDRERISSRRKDFIYLQETLKPYIEDILASDKTSQIEKINDTVCSLLTYNENRGYNVVSDLRQGQGSCDTYAVLFKYMMNACGYDCDYVSGTATGSNGEGDHAWNRVPTENGSLLVDVCWNDASGDKDYFMKPDFSADHTEMTFYDWYDKAINDDTKSELEKKLEAIVNH